MSLRGDDPGVFLSFGGDDGVWRLALGFGCLLGLLAVGLDAVGLHAVESVGAGAGEVALGFLVGLAHLFFEHGTNQAFVVQEL